MVIDLHPQMNELSRSVAVMSKEDMIEDLGSD